MTMILLLSPLSLFFFFLFPVTTVVEEIKATLKQAPALSSFLFAPAEGIKGIRRRLPLDEVEASFLLLGHHARLMN